MTAQEGIDSGFAATYVPQDVAAARLREANQRNARGNLAAILCDSYGVDLADPDRTAVETAAVEFAELCEALGLDGTPGGES